MRATYWASIAGTHHILRCQGFRSLSLRRRAIVCREIVGCAVTITSASASNANVHVARPAGGAGQAVAISRAPSRAARLRPPPRRGGQQTRAPLPGPAPAGPARHQRLQLLALAILQLDAVSYVHPGLLLIADHETPADATHATPVHRDAGPVPGLHRRLSETSPAGPAEADFQALFPGAP